MHQMEPEEFTRTHAQPCVDYLAEISREIESLYPKPKNTGESFRYEEPGVEHFCLLKSFRVISALNALLKLWESGYVQEMGVLCRTVSEMCNDIVFMLEGYPSPELEPNQERIFREWLKEEFEDPNIPFNKESKRQTVARKKVHASIARTINATNPNDQQKIIGIVEDVYSGYVHAAYPHIMEMYGGDPPRFHLDGMINTPRIEAWRKTLVYQLHQSINTFAFMCHMFGLVDRCKAIVQMRNSFEKDLGLNFTRTPEEMLKVVKKGRTTPFGR